jgi:hypothetical protein
MLIKIIYTYIDNAESILPSRKRSEMLATDMTSIYRAQITALWENVEGSQVLLKCSINK